MISTAAINLPKFSCGPINPIKIRDIFFIEALFTRSRADIPGTLLEVVFSVICWSLAWVWTTEAKNILLTFKKTRRQEHGFNLCTRYGHVTYCDQATSDYRKCRNNPLPSPRRTSSPRHSRLYTEIMIHADQQLYLTDIRLGILSLSLEQYFRVLAPDGRHHLDPDSGSADGVLFTVHTHYAGFNRSYKMRHTVRPIKLRKWQKPVPAVWRGKKIKRMRTCHNDENGSS